MKKIIFIVVLFLCSISHAQYTAHSHWKERYSTPLKDTVLSNFDGGVGVEWTATAGDSARNDLTNVRNGSQSIRLYCSGTTSTVILKTFTSINLSDYDQFSVTLRVPDSVKWQADSSNTSLLQIVVGTTASRYWLKDTKLSAVNTFDNGWYKLVFHKNQFTINSNPTWDSITRVQVRLTAQTGLRRNITLDQITAQKSAVQHPGVVFWLEPDSVRFMQYASGVFEKYGYKFTMSMRGKYGAPFVDSLVKLQSKGNDIVCYPWNYVDLRTLTATGIDTELVKVKSLLVSKGLRGNSIVSFSLTYHNRIVDSIAKINGFEWGRGSNLYTYPAPLINFNVYPAYNANMGIGAYSYTGETLDSLKKIVDLAITKKNVIIFAIRGVNVNATLSSYIDTGRLDSLLSYCYDKQNEGNLGYVGKFTNYLIYSPDSCIYNKSRSNGEIIDSISILADSMRIALYDSNTITHAWDSITASPMLKGGSLHTFTTSAWSPGSYKLRERGFTNSSTIDSGLASYTYTVPYVAIDTALISGFYFRNKDGNNFPPTGWSIYFDTTTSGDLLFNITTTIASQSAYGFNGVVPSTPLAIRQGSEKNKPYIARFVNGTDTLYGNMYLSPKSGSGNSKQFFFFDNN